MRTDRTRPTDRIRTALSLALLVTALAAPAVAESPAAADASESLPKPESYWLLTEFDWGDDREIVLESILFDIDYRCHGRQEDRCELTQVTVDGEMLLAQFRFHEGELFQLAFLTPNLEPAQSRQHLPRVWQHLVDYVTEHRGAPGFAAELPNLETLELGPPRVTHLWKSPELEVRIGVGRRDQDLHYVAAFFSDPAQGKQRAAYHSGLAEADEKFRQMRGARRSRRGGG